MRRSCPRSGPQAPSPAAIRGPVLAGWCPPPWRAAGARNTTTTWFGPRLFGFLRELADNNDRAWFAANRDRFLADVQEPALAFIDAFGQRHLPALSEHLDARATVQGGSLFRIHRDLRFAADKTPYKTYVGIRFNHASGADAHAAGLYLRLEPRNCWMGAGVFQPRAKVAARVRDAIAAEPDRWDEVAHRSPFADHWDLAVRDDDRLVRVPTHLREAAEDHPHPDDLRLRSFAALGRLTQREVTSSDFDELLAERWHHAMPMLRFLAGALGLQL